MNYNGMSSVKVEAMLQKMRDDMKTENGEQLPSFNGAYEKSRIKEIVEQANSTGRIGTKVICVINPIYVHIPNWQRNICLSKANEIASNFCKEKWELPKLYVKDGKLWGADGMHRIVGAIKAKGIETVECEILNVDEKEAVELFLSQTEDRRRMSPSDYFNAAIFAEREEYIKMRDICYKNNVGIRADNIDCKNKPKNPIGYFTSLKDGVRICKANPQLLDKILKLINKLQWSTTTCANETNAYSAKTVRVLKKLYAYYKGREKEMENCLIENCKGTVFYNNVLKHLWQESIFDYLSNVIEENISSEITTIAS